MANFYSDNKSLAFHLRHPLMKKIVQLKEDNFADNESFDYAPRDFEDAMDSYNKVLEIVGDLSANILDPLAESVDEEGPTIVDNEVVYAKGTQVGMAAFRKAELMGMTLPRQYGGLNFTTVPYIMAGEIVARSDAAFCNLFGLQDCAETILEFGDDDMKDKYLTRICAGETAAMDLTEPDAGSDLQAVQLKATYDHDKKQWFLNGVKRFITNGDADVNLVLARSEEGTHDARGLSLFIYDRNDKALIVRRIENKLGIKGSPTCELVFKNAPAELCGVRKLGLIKYVMFLMNGARLGIGAQSLGLCEGAYREALKYAHEREQFGKPIIEFPAVYELVTNMKVRTDAVRALLYETSRFVDMYKAYDVISKKRNLTPEERKESKHYNRLADVYTPLIKLISSEYANSITYDSIQVHGGSGFMKDYPIQRMYRDARITSIYEGTSQLQVVAAIRGVVNGVFLNQIREYENTKISPNFDYLRDSLREMTDDYVKATDLVTVEKNNEYIDFHARRLVEMAGNIIMSYLLILDADRDAEFESSAQMFVKLAYAENQQRFKYIEQSEVKDLGEYKIS
ncbi:MAG: acyl-CoA dehydrogenase family protein [Bacteroidales bacterium]|jgi:alkylation response protein AidB-like acyl-CoA dehydrogenase|nr:acyl-CoA dehydrogenase family protein [Bacteroidales bacterium]